MRMAAILAAMEDGNYFKYAALAGGVTEVTARSWRQRGENLLATLRVGNDEVDDEIADWLMVFPNDYTPDNAMWDAPPPSGIPASEWVFILFYVLAARAEATAVNNSIMVIRSAGNRNWQAHAWWLERAHPAEYGRQQRIEHSGPDGGPIDLVTPDALIAHIREIREAEERKGK